MPDAPFISNGPMVGEYLPNLTRSVRAGDFCTIDALSDLLVDAEIATKPIESDVLLTGIATWAKAGDAPRPSIVAATAVRELSQRRGRPLHAGLDPVGAQLDLLQTTLIVDHLGGLAIKIDVSASRSRPAGGRVRPMTAAVTNADCRTIYDQLQLKAYAGSGAVPTIGNTLFKDMFFGAMEIRDPDGVKSVKNGLKYIDYASKAANTIVFITSIQLTLKADKTATHFRHDAGDMSRDVHVVATAEWKQGETLQEYMCLQGLVGVDTRANGPFPGLRTHWSLDQPKTGTRTGKLLRAKAGQANEFTPGGAGGEMTDAAGDRTWTSSPPWSSSRARARS